LPTTLSVYAFNNPTHDPFCQLMIRPINT
jgi:hypothetical protein